MKTTLRSSDTQLRVMRTWFRAYTAPWTTATTLLLAACFAVASSATHADEPAGAEPAAKVVRLEAMPEEITFGDRFAYHQILLTAVLETGERIDATRSAQLADAGDLIDVSSTRLVRPLANGAGELMFTLGDATVSIPFRAQGFDEPYPVSYVGDVSPAMSKMGCNAGTCHGAQAGKNGFKLSLRGYDPLFDHLALTDDLAGRRFNRSAPDNSLMLLKMSGGAPHTGGVLSQPGERNYELIRSWIAAGVKLDLDAPRVVSIELFPQEPQIPLPGMQQQLVVWATYSDGRRRDVTADAHIESSLGEVVEIDRHGLATAVRRGEAAALARFEGSYAAATMIVMGDRDAFEWREEPEHGPIDGLVHQKLRKMKVLPSGLCSDAEFVRRIHLDLTGLPPSPEEVRAFVADERETRVKRDELIDRLIGGPAYVEYWTNKWSDLLQVNRKFLGEEGAWALRNWIRQAVATNMPYDEFAHEVLTGSGSTLSNPPAAYYKVLREPEETMENTTQLFLAIRFNCNKCHDHPFERWTQDQYYHLAAYFAQVGRKDAPDYADKKIGGTAVEQAKALVEIVYDLDSGDVTHQRTGQIAAPEFPYEIEAPLPQDSSRRELLAAWVASPTNPYFAKSYANRMWSYLLGVGLIEPVDDIRAGNPPTNPELLEHLTEQFIASDFNVQELVRMICKSRAYQRSLTSNEWNADDQINYSHALARRLSAETLYDAVHQACGAKINLPGVPAGFLATQLPDPGEKLTDGFLDLFGRPPRESACECERSSGVMLGQMLNLVNGPTIAEAIAQPDNRIARAVAEHADDRQVVEQLYLAILNRFPTDDETADGARAIQAADQERLQAVAALERYEAEVLPSKQQAWEQNQALRSWTPLAPAGFLAASASHMARGGDYSIVISGHEAAKDHYTITALSPLVGVTGVRLEVLPDDSLPAKGPGRAENGNFVLNEITLTAAPKSDPAAARPVKLTAAKASFSQSSWDVAGAVDGAEKTGWAVAPKFGERHAALFETEENIQHDGGAILTFSLDQQFGSRHTIGRLRLSVTAAPRPLALEGPPENIAAILATPADERSDAQRIELTDYVRSNDAEWKTLQATVEALGTDPARSRLLGAQDLAWALINSPAFLFNR